MKLLSPIKIGPIELKNRVISTAHEAYPDFFGPTSNGERYMAYQERRAEGGAGLVILTAMHVHQSSQIANHFIYDPDDLARKMQELSTRLHRHGTKVFSQLFHLGVFGKSDGRTDMHPLWGFSNTISTAGEMAHEMSDNEIEEVIEGFANSAKLVTENGVDGVELHAAHGYLLLQSMSSWANKRTDKWGERLYFAKEVARRVREAIGPNKVLGFRISVDDFLRPEQGGLGVEKLIQLAVELADTGFFDYVNHSEGLGGADYARAVGSYRHPLGEWLPLTRALKAALKPDMPLVGVGKIATHDMAEQALQAGDCDLIGMTRAQISDPDLVRKLETGQAHRIRLCTGANQGCIDRSGVHPITCIQNPEVGEEIRFKKLEKAAVQRKKVLVIGGGPAGMKAAEIAARRGHDVTLAEAGDRLGGRLNYVESLGDATNLLSSISWIEQELNHLEVKVLTHTLVDELFVADIKPEHIILATGATPTNDLGIPSDASITSLTSDEAALGRYEGNKLDLRGTKALFVDRRGNYESGLIVESLARQGCEVTVSTPFLFFGSNIGKTHQSEYFKLLPQWGVEILPSTVVSAINEGVVTITNVYSGKKQELGFDLIVAGCHPKPCNGLYSMLLKYAPVTVVGDASAPRSALEAFREGDRAGRTLGVAAS